MSILYFADPYFLYPKFEFKSFIGVIIFNVISEQWIGQNYIYATPTSTLWRCLKEIRYTVLWKKN